MSSLTSSDHLIPLFEVQQYQKLDQEEKNKEVSEMKQNKYLCLLFLLVSLTVIFMSLSAISSVEARHDHQKKSKAQKHNKKHFPGPSPYYGSNPTHSSIFDVLSFGAKGDGISDDSKPFEAAWKAACKVPSATLQIPSEFKFLIKPITLQGPCMPQLVLKIDGVLLAPPNIGSWPKSSLFQWMNFKWIQNLTIQGSGIVDGQGSAWWYFQKRFKYVPTIIPTALRFYGSSDVTVRDIRIINSPQCHLKFDNSMGIEVNNITISSPGNSPNTDGIHLQNTKNVEIQHSNIGCGDDCVSIQTGCSNVHIHHISCGPGHGISLGGLGKDRSMACVSGIIVENINVQNALSGVRIKTWQGGVGSVENVSFSNIHVSDVKVPIMIDQFYCGKNMCKNQTAAVAISGIKYAQITGTYSNQPIHLACSNNVPCRDVDLIDIHLEPSPGYRSFGQASCWNSYGRAQAPLVPSSMNYCLKMGGGSIKKSSRTLEYKC